MLIPFPPAAHGAALQLWGWLSFSALRRQGRARAHSPGLIYFFKGGSFILVGLGGKEGWGFCKVSTAPFVYFSRIFSFLPVPLAFLLLPSPSVLVQACCVSCPYPPSLLLTPSFFLFPFFFFF